MIPLPPPPIRECYRTDAEYVAACLERAKLVERLAATHVFVCAASLGLLLLVALTGIVAIVAGLL